MTGFHIESFSMRKTQCSYECKSFTRPISCRCIWFFLVGLLLLPREIARAQPEASCSPTSSSNKYDWEPYNYYQILDLAPHDAGSSQSRKQRRKQRAKIKPVDIRKAYRKQAQLFHPDKYGKNRQNNSTKTTMTREETTARFARIAEAYEVLSDESKREDYDYFLLDCEDNLARQSQRELFHDGRNDGGFAFDEFSTDPWSVFENFFNSDSGPQAGRSWEDDIFGNGGSNGYASPRRVYEREELLYDPHRGVQILRMLQTEEYDVDPRSGRYYYRVIGQDYMEQNYPFRGYQPISDPFVVEEGYLQSSDYANHGSDGFGQPSSRRFPDKILAGEALYPEAQPLLSSNGRFYAGITAECDFVVMSSSSSSGPLDEDKVVWSSDSYVPLPHLMNVGGCFLSLQGPRLVLALGSPDIPGSILWHSEVSNTEETAMNEGGRAPIYYARLDDYGSIGVYSQRIQDDSSESRPFENWRSSVGKKMESYSWWANYVEKSRREPRTRAAKAWVALRSRIASSLLRSKARAEHSRSSKAGENNSTTRETCVFATGFGGCNSPARKLLQTATEMTRSVKDTVQFTVSKIDRAVDEFSEFLNEETDDDEDILDTVLRIATAAGRGIGRSGAKFARTSAKVVRNTMKNHIRWRNR